MRQRPFGLLLATLLAAVALGGAADAAHAAHASRRAKTKKKHAAVRAVAATPAPEAARSPAEAMSASTNGSASAATATPAAPVATETATPVPRSRPPAAKVLAPSSAAKHASASTPKISLEPATTVNGGVVLAKIDGLVEGDLVTGSFAGEYLPVTAGEGYASFLVGVDLKVEPGTYPVTVRVRRGAKHIVKTATLAVKDAGYSVQRLTLPKKKVSDFDPATLARIELEAKTLAAIWPHWDPQRYWTGPFMKPLPGGWSELFGGQRVINGEPHAPHSGIDQHGKEGEGIQAINAGKIVYVGEQFFCGNMTVIDHGQGVFSMYCHQSKTLVKPGDMVRKGQVIGLVGHTGRATGPHLHWGLRVEGARIDPQRLLGLTLPETPGAPAAAVVDSALVLDSSERATTTSGSQASEHP